MHDDIMQKISQFLDDELPSEEAAALLHKMRDQAPLADKLRRYEAVAQALKNDGVVLTASPDFAVSVSSRIRQEATYLLPAAAQRQHSVRSGRFKRSHKIAAAAASVAVIAFIAHTQRQQPVSQAQMARAEQTPDAAAKRAAQAEVFTTLRDPYPVNQQINDYLQAHNASIYTNGLVDFQTYAQVTRYDQK